MLYKKYHRSYIRRFKKGTVIKKLIQGKGMYCGRISTDPEFNFTSYIVAPCNEFITNRYSNVYLVDYKGKLLLDIDNLFEFD